MLRPAKLSGPDRDGGKLADAEQKGELGKVRRFSKDIRDRLRRREIVGEDGGEWFGGDGRELWSADTAEAMLLKLGASIGAKLGAEAARRSADGPSWSSVADAKAEATAHAAGLWYRGEVCHCPALLGIRAVRDVVLVPLADEAGVLRTFGPARAWRSASFLRLWRSSLKAARRVLGGFRDGGRTGRKGDTGRGVDVPYSLAMESGYTMDTADDVADWFRAMLRIEAEHPGGVVPGCDDDDGAETAADAAAARVVPWLREVVAGVMPSGATGADATRRAALQRQAAWLLALVSGQDSSAAALAAGYDSEAAAALAVRRGSLLNALAAASLRSHPERIALRLRLRALGVRAGKLCRDGAVSARAAVASAVRARDAVRAWDKWSADAWREARRGLRAGYLRA